MDNCNDCYTEVKSEPSAITKDDLTKVLVLGLITGLAEKNGEMDSSYLKGVIEQTFTPVADIRAEIERHCGLIKEDHCKLCTSCHTLMSVREILNILDRYNKKGEYKDAVSD